MKYVKHNWQARQGTNLNKFKLEETGCETKEVTFTSLASITEEGDAFSKENMDDLERRIDTGFAELDSDVNLKSDKTALAVAIGSIEALQEDKANKSGNFENLYVGGIKTSYCNDINDFASSLTKIYRCTPSTLGIPTENYYNVIHISAATTSGNETQIAHNIQTNEMYFRCMVSWGKWWGWQKITTSAAKTVIYNSDMSKELENVNLDNGYIVDRRITKLVNLSAMSVETLGSSDLNEIEIVEDVQVFIEYTEVEKRNISIAKGIADRGYDVNKIAAITANYLECIYNPNCVKYNEHMLEAKEFFEIRRSVKSQF